MGLTNTRFRNLFKSSSKLEAAPTESEVARRHQTPTPQDATARPATATTPAPATIAGQDEVREQIPQESEDQVPAGSTRAAGDSPEFPLKQLQQRLWNDAYEQLKADEEVLVEKYEELLLHHLQENEETTNNTITRIESDPEKRWKQMEMMKDAGLEKTRKEANFKAKFDSGLQVIAPIRDIIEKSLKASQEATVVWSGISLIFEVVASPVSEPGANRDGLTEVLSMLEWYQQLTTEVLEDDSLRSGSALHSRLEKEVVGLYQAILSYQMKSICLYNRNRGVVILRDFVKYDDWDGKLNSVKDKESALAQKLNSVNNRQTQNKLSTLYNTSQSQIMELKGIFQVMRLQATEQLEAQQDKKFSRFMQDVRTTDPRDDKKRIEQNKGGLLKASFQWILTHEDFQRWQNPDSRLLWIKGDPGKGKTMLLCGIIDHLESQNPCYFFCEATKPGHSTATDVVRGLIFLLLKQHPSLISHGLEEHKTSGKELFTGPNAWMATSAILENMLRDPVLNGKPIIIDALDECDSDVQLLLKFIVDSTQYSRVKWLLSSRNERHIETKLRSVAPESRLSLELSENATQVAEAVGQYIDYQVSSLPVLEDDEDRLKQVKETFRVKSQGTFLWVALVVKELENAEEWEIDEILDDLPDGLNDLYKRMLNQIDKLSRKSPQYCRSLLSTMAIAYRPLQVKEAAVLSGLPPNILQKGESVKELIKMCGSFLTLEENKYREDRDTVHFVHLSARDFLTSDGAERVFLDGVKGQHHQLFIRSLDYLTDFLRRDMYSLEIPHITFWLEAPYPDPLYPARYSCEYWVDHFQNAKADEDASPRGLDASGGLILKFFENSILFWIEALCLMGKLSQGVLALNKLQDLLHEEKLQEWTYDTYRFVLTFRAGIEHTPLQIYHSGLVYSPEMSLIRQTYSQAHSDQWRRPKPPVAQYWDSCIQTLGYHDGPVPQLGLSGKRLASATYDGIVKVWDWTTGECLRTISAHECPVHAVTFFGDHIVSGGAEGLVKIWDSSTGTLINSLQAFSLEDFGDVPYDWFPILSVQSCKNSLAIVLQGQNLIQIWYPESTGLVKELRNPGEVQHLAYDSGRLATISFRQTLTVWDLTTETVLWTEEVRKIVYRPLALSGQQLAVALKESIRIWDASTGNCLHIIDQGHEYIRTLRLSDCGNSLHAITKRHVFRTWDLRNHQPITTQIDIRDSVPCKLAVFIPDSSKIVSISGNEAIRVFEYSQGKSLEELKVDEQISAVVFSSDGLVVASGSTNGLVRLWDSKTGKSIRDFKAQRSAAVERIEFSPDSSRLIFATYGTVEAWDLLTGYRLWIVSKEKGCPQQQILCSSTKSRMISWKSDQNIRISDLFSGDFIRNISYAEGNSIPDAGDNEPWSASNVPDPSCSILAALRLPNHNTQVWDLEGNYCILSIEESVRVIDTQPAGLNPMFAFVLVKGNYVHIWNKKGEITRFPLGRDYPPHALAISESRLATACWDDVRIWDITTGECLCMIQERTERLVWQDSDTKLRMDFRTVILQPPSATGEPFIQRQIGLNEGWLQNSNHMPSQQSSSKAIWVPPGYRPQASAIFGDTMAFGYDPNQVIFLPL